MPARLFETSPAPPKKIGEQATFPLDVVCQQAYYISDAGEVPAQGKGPRRLHPPGPTGTPDRKGLRMQTVTSAAPAVKPSRNPRPRPARTIRLLAYLARHRSGLFQVTEGAVCDHYHFAEVPADFGRGFRVSKLTPGTAPESYDVNVGGPGEPASCECKGHTRWGHCRHVSGLLKLIDLGKLPAAPADGPAPVEPPAPRVCRVCRRNPLAAGLGTCTPCQGF